MSTKALLTTAICSFAALALSVGASAAEPPKPQARAAASASTAAKPATAKHTAAKAAPAPTLPLLSAAEVVEKNVAARGGLSAWRSVQTLSWKGTMGAGATTYAVVTQKGHLEQKQRDEAMLPFLFEFKRPQKSRLEIEFNGQSAVQVFDGKNGWKLRPFLGRNDWEAFTPEELKASAAQPGIDGLLIDYAAKGAKVDLAGTDMVENHAAYKLKVTRKDGQVRRVWVDGQSYLDVKVEGDPRKLDGKPHAVAIYLRDFRREQNLMLPHLLETVVEGGAKSEKINIESVSVNPSLDDSRFTKGK
jgi:outer membrane lipoprotein-sorting protein